MFDAMALSPVFVFDHSAKLPRAEPRPRRLQGLILRTGVQREMAGHCFGPGTVRPLGTDIASPAPKFHGDLGGAVAIDLRRPGARDFSLGTDHLLVLPVNRKLLYPIGAFHLRLPADIRSGGPDQVNAVVLTATDEQGRLYVGGIDQVLLRGQV